MKEKKINVVNITTQFTMNNESEIDYTIKIVGDISKVVEAVHKIGIECKKRVSEFNDERNKKTFGGL